VRASTAAPLSVAALSVVLGGAAAAAATTSAALSCFGTEKKPAASATSSTLRLLLLLLLLLLLPLPLPLLLLPLLLLLRWRAWRAALRSRLHRGGEVGGEVVGGGPDAAQVRVVAGRGAAQTSPRPCAPKTHMAKTSAAVRRHGTRGVTGVHAANAVERHGVKAVEARGAKATDGRAANAVGMRLANAVGGRAENAVGGRCTKAVVTGRRRAHRSPLSHRARRLPAASDVLSARATLPRDSGAARRVAGTPSVELNDAALHSAPAPAAPASRRSAESLSATMLLLFFEEIVN